MKKVAFACLFTLLGAPLVSAKDTHQNLIEEMIASFNKLSDVLVTIKDKKSADVAKSKVETIGKLMADLKKRADILGEPKGEQKEELEKRFKQKMEDAAKRMTCELIRIAKNIDGGQEIVKEISTLLGGPSTKAKEKG